MVGRFTDLAPVWGQFAGLTPVLRQFADLTPSGGAWRAQ